MLNDVLIICHFRLCAPESLVYTETYAGTLLFLGMPIICSAELPTVPCYRLYAPCFCNSQVSFPLLFVSSCWHLPDGPFFCFSVIKMLPSPPLSEAFHGWLCPLAFSFTIKHTLWAMFNIQLHSTLHFIMYSIFFVTYFYVQVSPCISTFVLMFSTMLWAFLVAQMVKNLPIVQETQVWSLDQEDPLRKGMDTHWSILAWRISWTEEPGGLQFVWFQRVRHDGATNTFHFLHLSSLSN